MEKILSTRGPDRFEPDLSVVCGEWADAAFRKALHRIAVSKGLHAEVLVHQGPGRTAEALLQEAKAARGREILLLPVAKEDALFFFRSCLRVKSGASVFLWPRGRVKGWMAWILPFFWGVPAVDLGGPSRWRKGTFDAGSGQSKLAGSIRRALELGLEVEVEASPKDVAVKGWNVIGKDHREVLRHLLSMGFWGLLGLFFLTMGFVQIGRGQAMLGLACMLFGFFTVGYLFGKR